MKIAIVVFEVASAPGFEEIVSAHVQVPLHIAGLLKTAGHTVQIITTRFDASRTLPTMLPDVVLHQVTDGRRRNGMPMFGGHQGGVRGWGLVQLAAELRGILHRERYDVVQLWGGNRMGYFSALIRALGFKGVLALGMEQADLPDPRWPLGRPLWRGLDAIITATEHIARPCRAAGLPAHCLPHGLMRPLAPVQPRRRHRVLFWRDPSVANGADTCVAAFARLAPRWPDVRFDFAVRPHPDPVAGLDALPAKHPNVHVLRCPYEDGITLEQLLDESLCVVLPFRRLSTHPQLAVLESMARGIPVVASSIGSNPELITDGETGRLVDADDTEAVVAAIDALLSDPQAAHAMGQRAAQAVERDWHWRGYVERLIAIYEDAARAR